jgi:hypothetical protein
MNTEWLKQIFGTEDVEQIRSQKREGKQEGHVVSKKIGKVDVSAAECKRLCTRAGIEYVAGYEDRVLEYTLSDATVDRMGDIIKPKGADLNNFKKNPVLLAFHDYGTIPVGAIIKVWNNDKAVKGWCMFFGNEIDPSGRAETMYRLAKSGFMRAGSVGFLPKEVHDPDKEERKELDMPDYGVVFTKWELMEFSVCPVPANPNATQSIRKGVMTAANAQEIKGDIEQGEEIVQMIGDMNIMPRIKQMFHACDATGDVYEVEVEGKKDIVLRPYSNEHSARLMDPDEMDPVSVRRTNGSGNGTVQGVKIPKSISIIWYVMDEEGKEIIPQALRFPVDTWTEEQAKEWIKNKEIDIIKFEPAEKSVTLAEVKGLLVEYINKQQNLNDRLEAYFEGSAVSGDSEKSYGDLLFEAWKRKKGAE